VVLGKGFLGQIKVASATIGPTCAKPGSQRRVFVLDASVIALCSRRDVEVSLCMAAMNTVMSHGKECRLERVSFLGCLQPADEQMTHPTPSYAQRVIFFTARRYCERC